MNHDRLQRVLDTCGIGFFLNSETVQDSICATIRRELKNRQRQSMVAGQDLLEALDAAAEGYMEYEKHIEAPTKAQEEAEHTRDYWRAI